MIIVKTLAKDLFVFEALRQCPAAVTVATARAPSGFFLNLFSNHQVGPNGQLLFKGHTTIQTPDRPREDAV